jgi:hypothetical protein
VWSDGELVVGRRFASRFCELDGISKQWWWSVAVRRSERRGRVESGSLGGSGASRPFT